jgi:spore maturation protein CgeB
LSSSTRVAIVGGFDAAHIGGSFMRAAQTLGIEAVPFDSADAWAGTALGRALRWRFADRRPTRLEAFGAGVVEACAARGCSVLISTGSAPLTATALRRLSDGGVTCINYSTDDPWNALSRSGWFLHALPNYRIVATTRRANVGDLRRLGCADVRHLPFGYDGTVHRPPSSVPDGARPDVLFVGGADDDRAVFLSAFMRSDLSLMLVGGYWGRFAETRRFWAGCKTPEDIRNLTAAAKVNLCLVRRANRDGHVMRSFEIAAIGGCILAEDTGEHRELFGPDGESAVYFKTPKDAVSRARSLVGDEARRARLAGALRRRIVAGGHSYRDRLETMMTWQRDLESERHAAYS